MKGKPLVSVIIPVYNCERYLGESIESVLEQTYSPLELIVVDDGSTDGSAVVARRYKGRLIYISQPNGGISAARNRGIALAGGGFLAFLDSDDCWTEKKLEVQMRAFEADPGLEMVFGHAVQYFSLPSHKGLSIPSGKTSAIIPAVVPGVMVVRAESFQRVGLFDPETKLGEFLEWYARAREMGLRQTILPDLLLKRRIHGDNIGIRDRGKLNDYARILKASLDRRRAREGGHSA